MHASVKLLRLLVRVLTLILLLLLQVFYAS